MHEGLSPDIGGNFLVKFGPDFAKVAMSVIPPRASRANNSMIPVAVQLLAATNLCPAQVTAHVVGWSRLKAKAPARRV